MIPLTLAKAGDTNCIEKIGGKLETKQFVENLGFVVGGVVIVIAAMGGNVIVNVKDARIAISREMANNIMVQSITKGDSGYADIKRDTLWAEGHCRRNRWRGGR